MKDFQLSNKDYASLASIARSSGRTPEAVLRQLIQSYGNELVQPAHIDMDLAPALNGAYKTQKQWIELYNSQQGEFKGKRMLTSSDVINVSDVVDSLEALASLQRDCRKDWIVTSTHIGYTPANLSGTITHNYQSTVVQPRSITLDNIPVYQRESVKNVVETSEGRAYLRALADDRHINPVTLLKRLSLLSQREPKDIVLWTPDQSSRAAYSERAVRFVDDGHRFRVFGDNFFGVNVGRSRGVSVSLRSRRAKK